MWEFGLRLFELGPVDLGASRLQRGSRLLHDGAFNAMLSEGFAWRPDALSRLAWDHARDFTRIVEVTRRTAQETRKTRFCSPRGFRTPRVTRYTTIREEAYVCFWPRADMRDKHRKSHSLRAGSQQ